MMICNADWIALVYNTGYNDGLKNQYRESFSEQMRGGAMEEEYERGWTAGLIDRSKPGR